jgi:hypothetical protein
VAQAGELVDYYEQISKEHGLRWLNQKQHRNFRGFRPYRAMLPGECQ